MVSDYDHLAGGFRNILLKLHVNTRGQSALSTPEDQFVRSAPREGRSLSALRGAAVLGVLSAMALLIGCGGVSPNLGVAPTQSSLVSNIFPSSVTAGGPLPQNQLTVNGEGFVNGSLVLWNQEPITTTYVNGSQLLATVPAADLNPPTVPATVSIGVISPGKLTNDTKGDNLSNFLPFTILPAGAAAPTISQGGLSPSSAAAGGPAFTLTVTGTGFLSTSTVNWSGLSCLITNNAVCIVTSFVSATQLTAQVPAQFIATVPTNQPQITVYTPNGGTSNPAPFTITSTQPALTKANVQNALATGAQHSPAITAGPRFVAFVAVSDSSSTGTSVGEIFCRIAARELLRDARRKRL